MTGGIREVATAARWAALALASVAAAGCVYDSGARCDENEELSADGKTCTCVAGAVMTDHACVLCGANEVPGPGACVCAPGFARAAAGMPCQAMPGGLGAACDTASTPCTDATYAHCQVTSGSAGYCTSTGCASSGDCTGGYACDTSGAVPFCRRPPVGAGMSCQSNADCAGTEATFCDAVVTHTCRVQGCTLSPDDCFEGTQCCDLSGFGVPQPICVQSGTCPT
jgi:hypothetical protein